MKKEIWKDIPEYEGLYQVSNYGIVRSLKFNKIKILKPAINGNGYLNVVLWDNGVKKTFTNHQLVAYAFLNHKPCGLKLVIDHINNDKLDNKLENLQIVTNRHNVRKLQGAYTSIFKGVCWIEKRQRWQSQAFIAGHKKHIGYFTNEYDAHLAYQNTLNQYNVN
jgi:hypothetical protein